MVTRTSLIALLLLAAAPASAECVYKRAFNHMTGEEEMVPFSCPPVEASQTPKYKRWHECPVYEERNPQTGKSQRIRTCA